MRKTLDNLLARPMMTRDHRAGWCEKHNHSCPQLEVARLAARTMGAMTLATAEEKSMLWGKPCKVDVQ